MERGAPALALKDRLSARLRPLAAPGLDAPVRGDFDLNPAARKPDATRALTPAAVLVPIVARPEGPTVLFTLRTDTLARHAGQVSFPGGRMEPGDGSPVATALRETAEETGLAPEFIEPLGLLDTYETVTAYAVVPVVALVRPGFTLAPDPTEVAEIFEAPLDFLMDPARHVPHSREWQGGTRRYYAMPYGRYTIWGATAGMIVNLQQRLSGS